MTKKKIKPATPAKPKTTPPPSGVVPGVKSPASALANPAPVEAPAGAPIPPETTHPIEPILSAEQLAEVDQLAGRISETEKDPAADPDQDPEHADLDQPPASFLDDASMTVDLFVMFATDYCKEVGPLWPKEKKETVSKALSLVFKKYNFSFARFGPEIGLLVVAGPVLYQTSKVIALSMQQAPVQQMRAHEAKEVTRQ